MPVISPPSVRELVMIETNAFFKEIEHPDGMELPQAH